MNTLFWILVITGLLVAAAIWYTMQQPEPEPDEHAELPGESSPFFVSNASRRQGHRGASVSRDADNAPCDGPLTPAEYIAGGLCVGLIVGFILGRLV